jgi:aminopeptidase YwaD
VFEPLIDKRAAALLDEVKAAYTLQASQRKTPAAEPAMTVEEKDASALLVECVHSRGREQAGVVRLVRRP